MKTMGASLSKFRGRGSEQKMWTRAFIVVFVAKCGQGKVIRFRIG